MDDDSVSSVKVWNLFAAVDEFALKTANDSHTGTQTVFVVSRNGTTPESFCIPNAQVGIGTEILSGVLTIDQPSTGGAIPVLTLDQADVDHSFIDFVGGTSYGGMNGTNQYLKVKINGAVKYLRLFD